MKDLDFNLKLSNHIDAINSAMKDSLDKDLILTSKIIKKMNKDTSITKVLTNELRWLERKQIIGLSSQMILQQKWIDSITGKEFWENVKIVSE